MPGALAPPTRIADEHALVEQETSFVRWRIDSVRASDFLAAHCDWFDRRARPSFAQGSAEGIPIRVCFEGEGATLWTQAPHALRLARLLR